MSEIQRESITPFIPLSQRGRFEGEGGVLFGGLWRLTMLALPWQTRWFTDASLGGWPWEQGRWSVYASMLLMLATILFGYRSLRKMRWERLVVPIMCFAALSLLTTFSIVATAQWWLSVLLLCAFVVVLRYYGVTKEQIAPWFVASILPHAALAIWQYLAGDVAASSWFGIASHPAEALGSAVIEHDDVRILRAYGGFPHPNILGGWLAIGLLTAFASVARATSKYTALMWSGAIALMAAALVVTYARSAWLAFCAGICVFIAYLVRRSMLSARCSSPKRFSWQFVCIALFAVAMIGGAVLVSQRAHVFARFDVSHRLELKSVDVRKQSLVDGWRIFTEHPLFGTGPNAELLPLLSSCKAKCVAPLEPPHAVPLLVLEDVGIIGVAFMLYGVFRLRRQHRAMSNEQQSPPVVQCLMCSIPCLIALIILSLFDHYLWSTWSGMCLIAMTVALLQNPSHTSS